jgi:hypothetical protein
MLIRILERLDEIGYGDIAQWALEERSPHKVAFEKLKIFKDSRELSSRGMFYDCN